MLLSVLLGLPEAQFLNADEWLGRLEEPDCRSGNEAIKGNLGLREMTDSDKQPVTQATTLTGSLCDIRVPSVGLG